MRRGAAMISFHIWQQCSEISPSASQKYLALQLSRLNCPTFTVGFSSRRFGGSGGRVVPSTRARSRRGRRSFREAAGVFGSGPAAAGATTPARLAIMHRCARRASRVADLGGVPPHAADVHRGAGSPAEPGMGDGHHRHLDERQRKTGGSTGRRSIVRNRNAVAIDRATSICTRPAPAPAAERRGGRDTQRNGPAELTRADCHTSTTM